jgi:hypothetical protein
MKKYKLKEDARKFFDYYLCKDVDVLEYWTKKCIPIQLLDEVGMVHVKYGRQTSKNSVALCEFSKDGAIFEFTICAPDLQVKEYEKMNIPALMDIIQKDIDKYFKNNYSE